MSVNATASDITVVNTYVTGGQQDAAIAALPDGGWIATWMSAGQDGSGAGIYQQRFDASGNPVGGEIQVNTITESLQHEPSVSGLEDGGWVVAWSSYFAESENTEVFMQRYDSSGAAVGGEILVNTVTTGGQGQSSVTGLADGGYVVAWTSSQPNGDVFVQHYDSQGAAIDGETLLNTFTTNYQIGPVMTALPDGGYVATWMSQPQDGDDYGIFQQIYDDAGNALTGSESQVNTYTVNRQSDPDVALLADGGWVVTWRSEGPDGDQGGVYMQRFHADGTAFGSETLANSVTAGEQGFPGVAALADGGWVIVYQSWASAGTDIRMMRYDANGQAVGDETVISNSSGDNSMAPDIVALADGGWVVSWYNSAADGNDYGVQQRHFAADVDGTSGDDSLSGTAWGENISGLGGHDTLLGGAGADVLDGGTGNDSMVGGDGDDAYVIDSADDTVTESGDGGTDTVKAAIAFTLGANLENLILTGTDDLSGTGNSLDNAITGNDGANTLSGLEGSDTLSGGDGDDTLDGGAGTDAMSGGDGDDAYVVDSADDTATEAADDGTDTVSTSVGFALGDNLENLTLAGTDDLSGTGNGLDNAITGNAGANSLSGLAGNDTLSSDDGDDVLDGGAGNDTMIGGDGDDAYVVDADGDVVDELAEGGTDSISTALAYTLGGALENLILTGSDAVSGNGNGL